MRGFGGQKNSANQISEIPSTHSQVPWHTLLEDQIFIKLEAPPNGLTSEQVLERQQEFGLNRLPSKPPPSLTHIFLHQFLSPLIYILLIAAGVSAFIGEMTDVSFIAAILLLNAALGTFQEWKAERRAAALHSLLKIYARVRREGEDQEIPAEEFVPGDLCILKSGNRIPTDLRLTETINLTVDESLLTQEIIGRCEAYRCIA